MVVVDHPRALHEPADLLEELAAGLLALAARPWHRGRVVGEADEVVGHQLLFEFEELLLHERPLLRGRAPDRLELLPQGLPPLL